MDIIIALSSATLWHMKCYLESVIFLVPSQIIESHTVHSSDELMLSQTSDELPCHKVVYGSCLL